MALADFIFKGSIGGRNDPHIRDMVAAAANRPVVTVFQKV